jgi:catechol 2,3-dioxygenase-like lactoylglutathione lyase family enzyme
MINAIDHINIVVADLDRSVAFYTGVLGMEVTRTAHLEGDWIEAIVGLRGVEADVAYVEPPGGGLRLELLQYHSPLGEALPLNREPNTQGLRHIAFRVADIDAAAARLRAAGAPVVADPVAVPDGVVKHNAGRKRLLYFHDPDGVLLELAEYT